MNFTILQQLTEDLPSHERKQVFDSLPSTLQDEAWLNHATWVERRSRENEWLSSDSPLGFVEWTQTTQTSTAATRKG
jgi:hypothetical protein